MIENVAGIASAGMSASIRSPSATSAAVQGPSFEQALSQVIGGAVDTLKAGEAVAIQGVQGAVSPMKVVDGVMAAQRSLQTVLAVRDKAVSAYQEVARMAI
jgi:flagellar hook-basal body complex protein FliE